jgi:UDP-N-acetylmuramate--alanine ligase
VAAVIAAAKPIARGRLIVAFQPHRYTRTQLLMSEFGRAFAGADVVVVTDIYAAGEDPIPGVTLEVLANTVRAGFTGDVRVVPALADVPNELASVARHGDLIVLLGAGSIGSLAPSVVAALGGGN